MEETLKTQPLTVELLKEAKRIEFPDNVIAKLTGKTEAEIHDMRYENGIVAAYKMVDTCAAEFEAATPYYYSVFGSENEAEETNPQKKVLVLGSGPIRIGQGIGSITVLFTAHGHLKRRMGDSHCQQQSGNCIYRL